NVNTQINNLYGLLYGLIKSKVEGKKWPNKKQIWKKIGEGKEYSDERIRKYYSDLLRLIEEFLIIEEFNKKPLVKISYLLKSISNNHFKILENQAIKSAKTHSKR